MLTDVFSPLYRKNIGLEKNDLMSVNIYSEQENESAKETPCI